MDYHTRYMTRHAFNPRPGIGNRLLALAAGASLIVACAAAAPPSQLISPVASTAPALSDAQRNATRQAIGPLDARLSPLASATAPVPVSTTPPKVPRQPVTKDSGVFLPIPGATPATLGAIVQVQPPFSTNQYHIENSWYLDSPDATQRLMAYAGNVSGPGGQETDQGVLILETSVLSPTGGGRNVIRLLGSTAYTMTASGSLHITGAQPDRLLLQSRSGQVYSFLFPTHQFEGTAKQ